MSALKADPHFEIPVHHQKQFDLLAAVFARPDSTPAMLAATTGRDPRQVNDSLRALMSRGFLTRKPVGVETTGGLTNAYRITDEGRHALHNPARFGSFKRGRSKPPRTVSPVLRQLFTALDDRNLTVRELARRAGMNPNHISDWKHGRNSPGLVNIEAAAQVIGYRLALVPDDDRGQP